MEELKEKYRSLPVWARLLMAFIIGILPGACSYLDEAEILEASLSDAQAKESTARDQFEKNRREKANIPKLEEELAYTEEQLEKAKKSLPEGYLVENVLSLTANSAKSAGVQLERFLPTCELKGGGDFKYVEFPIDVQVTGKFQQIASFLDKLVHAEMMIFVRALDLKPVVSEETTQAHDSTPYSRSVEERRAQRLSADFKLVVFRAMKDEEESYFEARTSCEGGQDGESPDPNFAPGAPIKVPPVSDNASEGESVPPPTES